MKLGKLAPRRDNRNLKLARYLKKLPRLPIEDGYINKVKNWPMYLNDQLGDCVIAAAGHMIQQWTCYGFGQEVDITDADILKGYERVGGYNPNDPSTDQGCVMLEALKYWRKVGFGGHRIVAFVEINPQKPDEIEQAIYLFGNVYCGFALPISAQSQPDCWSVPFDGLQRDGSPGSWGGHSVPLMGYKSPFGGPPGPGAMAITWGKRVAVTWNFISAYCDEMYAAVTPDWVNAVGKSPRGLNLAQLLVDLATL